MLLAVDIFVIEGIFVSIDLPKRNRRAEILREYGDRIFCGKIV